MCDCYEHKCEICNELIPWHIGDFNFDRKEFKIWCYKHIQYAESGSVLFTLLKASGNDKKYGLFFGWQCAAKGPEIEPHGNNHPNSGSQFKIDEWDHLKNLVLLAVNNITQ